MGVDEREMTPFSRTSFSICDTSVSEVLIKELTRRYILLGPIFQEDMVGGTGWDGDRGRG